jgi:hypothetical protein
VPFYVGKGCSRRWATHECEARKGKPGYRSNIIRQMQTRGIEVPKVKLHEGLTEATAHEYEVALVAAIGRLPNGPLVNQTDGGEGASGYLPSVETRARLSAMRRGKKRPAELVAKTAEGLRGKPKSLEHRAKLAAANAGRVLPPETLAKIAAANRGRKHSAETRAKMSAVQSARTLSPEARANIIAAHRGKVVSAETRAKMSAAKRGKPLAQEHREKLRAVLRRVRAVARGEVSRTCAASRSRPSILPRWPRRIEE